MILAATSAMGESSSIGSGGATGSDRTGAAPDASLALTSLSGRDLPAFFLLLVLSQVDAAALAGAAEVAAVVAATPLVPALPNPVSL